MLIQAKIKNGLLLNDLRFLEDGEYYFKVISIEEKTINSVKRNYFVLLDDFCMQTGNNKYQIHDQYKNFKQIATTKEFLLQDWIDFLEEFKFWSMDKYQ